MPGLPHRSPPPDQRDREAAIGERRRNVLIDAGAGTGKTTTLVRRLIERLAPSDGGPAMKINRIAAVTFTRRAAGELRLRIRERLLAELAAPDLPAARRVQLQEAFAGLDGAAIGTIHGFADRLLRLHPVEAELSPSYEVAEDTQDLLHETLDALVHGAETGTLADALAGTPAAARAREAEETASASRSAWTAPAESPVRARLAARQ